MKDKEERNGITYFNKWIELQWVHRSIKGTTGIKETVQVWTFSKITRNPKQMFLQLHLWGLRVLEPLSWHSLFTIVCELYMIKWNCLRMRLIYEEELPNIKQCHIFMNVYFAGLNWVVSPVIVLSVWKD